MYQAYYGLKDAPFSITPDPYFVYLSECHRDALAHLLYGIQQGGSGGFVQLTGEVGTGKTTLSRLLLNQLPENTHAALILNPRLDPIELLETICDELKVPANGAPSSESPSTGKRRTKAASSAPKRTGKALFDALSAYLLDAYAKGDRVVLLIDEAQNLSSDALEQVRLLTNLETETQKLLQIILIGQPELRDTLSRPELRQLAQRITARYHLRPLDAGETEAYLRHRIATAGGERFPFSTDAVRRIFKHSGGVPRLINVIAERAMLGGYAQDKLTIDADITERAAREALAPASDVQNPSQRKALWTALALAATAAATVAAMSLRTQTDVPATATPAATNRAEHSLASIPKGGATTADDAALQAQNERASDAEAASSATAIPVPAVIDMPELTALVAATPDAHALTHERLRSIWQAPNATMPTAAGQCANKPVQGWRCLRSRATLDQLQRLNRPLLLRLQHASRDTWALLQSIDSAYVGVAIGERSVRIHRVAFAGLWNGEYLAIWPAPDGLEPRFAAAETAALDWVRQHLQASDTPIKPEDAGLSDALRLFQSGRGLRSDGILGLETLLALSAHDAGPQLNQTAE